MSLPQQQVVVNKGIYRGLPTYQEDVKDLVALVTGANGISGYHMVKVLASSPQRWKKVYCLSRRPPPDYFFDELGEGASHIEHVSVDFLEDAVSIANSLQGKIEHVYAFSRLISRCRMSDHVQRPRIFLFVRSADSEGRRHIDVE